MEKRVLSEDEKRVRKIAWEARCFWSRDRLRGVSCAPHMSAAERAQVLEFFAAFGARLPYHSATVDSGWAQETQRVELIEFNSFGPDLQATAGNFSWAEDMHQLLFGEHVEWR